MSPYYQTIRNKIGHDLLMIPAVAIVVHNGKGQLLLQQKQDGSWSLPAGAIEPGETPLVAAHRELLEETGLSASDFKTLGILGGNDYRFVYPNGDKVEYLVVLLKSINAVQTAKDLDSETIRLEYFAKDSLPHLALPYPIGLLYS